VALRLDANRAWELVVALDFARRAAPAAIEYLEEPLRDPGDLPGFVAHSPVPVALDETLLSFSPQAPPPLRGLAALVLKPSVLGGYERSMDWARLARREGLAAVVSAAFPSAVGMALDAAFAAAIGGDTAHGLGTSTVFARDLGRVPLAVEGGHIPARKLPFRPAEFTLERTRALR
jgi:O-succinylbenzoate synthase